MGVLSKVVYENCTNFCIKIFHVEIFCAFNFHLAIRGGCVLTLKDSNLILSTKSNQMTAFSHAAIAF